jgi:hypothetical protein
MSTSPAAAAPRADRAEPAEQHPAADRPPAMAAEKSFFDYFDRDGPRVRARLHSWRALRSISSSVPLVAPSADDMSAFTAAHPDAARELAALRAVGRAAAAGGTVGAVAGAVTSWRCNRMTAYLVIGGVLGGAAAASVADNVASWVFGTYTFDGIATAQVFNDFMRRRYPHAATPASRLGRAPPADA